MTTQNGLRWKEEVGLGQGVCLQRGIQKRSFVKLLTRFMQKASPIVRPDERHLVGMFMQTTYNV